MKAIVPILISFICFLAQAIGADKCPVCGGILSAVGTTKEKAQAANLVLGLPAFYGYTDDTLICTTCWHVDTPSIKSWQRASRNPGSFTHPLSADLRGFPLPPSKNITDARVVYSQYFRDGTFSEGVFFRCRRRDADYIRRAKAYADRHKLVLRVEQPMAPDPEINISAGR